MSDRIRVGIVGCGEVTQLLHIPALTELSALFEVTVLCDPSPTVLRAVSGRLPGARGCDKPEAVTEADDVDAVLVANPNPDHAPTAIAALLAGKHVLIEKPAFITAGEAAELAAAAARTGRIAQVGYMRRHASAYRAAARAIAPVLNDIILMRVHDVIGPNASFTGYGPVSRADDIPDPVRRATQARLDAAYREAISAGHDTAPGRTFSLLLGLSSHSTSAMRGLVGRPQSVLYSATRVNQRMVTAAFDYGHFVCHYECGVDAIPRFGSVVEVHCREALFRLTYDTPYLRNLPCLLETATRTSPTGWERTIREFDREDQFTSEWKAFHHAITTGQALENGIGDALEDLELFTEMIDAMRRSERQEAVA